MEVVKKDNTFFAKVFYDKIAYFFVKKLAKTKIQPNHLSFFGLFLDFISAYLFFLGEWKFLIIAGFLIQISLLMDRMDGQLARMKGIASKYGQLLDEGLGVFGMSIIFIGAIGGYFARTGEVFIWYLGFFGLLGLLMMNLFSHLAKEIYGSKNNAGKKLREKINKKSGRIVPSQALEFSAEVQRSVMSISGFVNYIPLFLWIFTIVGNFYWIARFFVYAKRK